MFKTVIFDFDGTIADTLPAIIELFNPIAEENGFPQITDTNINELKNSSALELVKKYKVSPLRLLKFQKDFQAKILNKIEKIPLHKGIKTMLKELEKHQIVIGIVTSNSKTNVEKFLKKNKLSVNFIYSEKNIFGKGKVLKHVLKKYNIDSSETIYVGDEVRDIEAARQAGMKVIAVTWGFNSEMRLSAAKPDWLVSQPRKFFDKIC